MICELRQGYKPHRDRNPVLPLTVRRVIELLATYPNREESVDQKAKI
jgi:hypothetical protein